ncbi:hypothetical protein H0H93_009426 [Arthromyces matolae]|nr:hypothetical protein H0H93_009426 [Arthromyces matolae]
MSFKSGPNPEFVTDLPTYPSLPESERRHLDEVVSLSKIRYDSLLKVCKYYDLEIQRQKKYLLCLRQNGPDLSEDALHDLFSPNIVATRLISSWQDVCMKHRSESCILATRCRQLPPPAFKDLRTILTVIDQQHRELGERFRHLDLDLEQVLTQCDDYWDDFVSGLNEKFTFNPQRSIRPLIHYFLRQNLEDDALLRANIGQQEGAGSTASPETNTDASDDPEDVDIDEETILQIINHAPNAMSLIARSRGQCARLESVIIQLQSEIEIYQNRDAPFRTDLEVSPPSYDQALAEGAFDEWSDAEISGAADFAPPHRLDYTSSNPTMNHLASLSSSDTPLSPP